MINKIIYNNTLIEIYKRNDDNIGIFYLKS